jgi:hypothetical protein
MKRQLALPGTLRRPARLPVAAKKDLSAAAFERALARNGFKAIGTGFLFADMRCCGGQCIQAQCRVNPIRIARRATLAKLIRTRDAR